MAARHSAVHMSSPDSVCLDRVQIKSQATANSVTNGLNLLKLHAKCFNKDRLPTTRLHAHQQDAATTTMHRKSVVCLTPAWNTLQIDTLLTVR